MSRMDKDDARNPARQTGDDKGTIKKAQLTDATMPTKDMAQGSEPATGHSAERGRR